METSRQLTCAGCGGTVIPQEGEPIAFCEYCGTYSNPDGTVYRPDHDELSDELGRKMEKAAARKDRVTWRRHCYEYCLLEIRRYPERHPNCPAQGPELNAYIEPQVKQNELLVFDPGVKAAFERCQELINRLMTSKGNHIAEGKELLDAYRAYFGTFLYHPEYPYPVQPGEPEQLALDTARSALEQYEPLWGKKALARVRQKVFGDKRLSSGQPCCASCGALLDDVEDGAATCPSCGSVTYIEA